MLEEKETKGTLVQLEPLDYVEHKDHRVCLDRKVYQAARDQGVLVVCLV